MKKSRARSATLSYAAIGINIVVTLLFTPFLIGSLGTEGYGLVSLAIAFLAYLNILDMGLNDALLRFFVTHEGDMQKTQGFLGRMLSFYMVIGCTIFALGWLISYLIPAVFGASMTSGQMEELQAMVIVMALGAGVLIGLNPISALAYAHERHFAMKLIELGVLLGTTGLTVILLLQGTGPFSVVAVSAAGKIVQGLLRVLLVRYSIGARFRLHAVQRKEILSVYRYAAPIFVSIVAGALFWKFDNILIGAVLGVAPIAVYTIGITFNKYFQSFATTLSRIMTPEIIRRVDQNADPVELTDLMIRISRFQAMVLLVILSGLLVFGQRFLILWLGDPFGASYWIMVAILPAFALELIGNARNIILQVKGLYWYKSAITFLAAAINVLLTFLLLKTWGVLGAAVSTGISILIGYAGIAVLLKMRVGMEMGRYWKGLWRGIFPIMLVSGAIGLWAERFLPDGWPALLLGGAALAATQLLLIYFFAADAREQKLLRGLLARGGGRKRSK